MTSTVRLTGAAPLGLVQIPAKSAFVLTDLLVWAYAPEYSSGEAFSVRISEPGGVPLPAFYVEAGARYALRQPQLVLHFGSGVVYAAPAVPSSLQVSVALPDPSNPPDPFGIEVTAHGYFLSTRSAALPWSHIVRVYPGQKVEFPNPGRRAMALSQVWTDGLAPVEVGSKLLGPASRLVARGGYPLFQSRDGVLPLPGPKIALASPLRIPAGDTLTVANRYEFGPGADLFFGDPNDNGTDPDFTLNKPVSVLVAGTWTK